MRWLLQGLRTLQRPIQSRSLHLCPSLWGRIVQFNLSDIGEGIAEVEIKEWHVAEGDTIAQFDDLCEVQSDKATVTITSRYSGTVAKLHYATNDIAAVGRPLVDIELAGDDDSAPAASAATAPSPPTPPPKVELSQVGATGKFGHVLKEDVLRFLDGGGAGTERAPVALSSAADSVVPIRGYARAMVKTMALANQIPHFGYCDEVCVDRLVSLRSELATMAKERGIKMSYMPLFIKAASLALLQFPILNASLDQAVENMTYRSAHNICVAMDTPGGLLVPNIKHCEQKNLWDIAQDLNRLHEAGKSGGIASEDLQDGTFTLSNIGSIGGTYASPVIFPPQVAIGALGKIQVVPRFVGEPSAGVLGPTQLVKVSWSADHRVVDGATMARFSNVWKRYLENPGLMIAEMK